MAEVGNDCYFFFNSTCIKGSQCQFRHCEEALGSDTVCSLWRERKCLDPLCRFRHMEMQQNCSISCFWETRPLGCVKISCIFYHSKPRNINGLFLPPSSNITLQKESQEGIPLQTQSQEPLKPQENVSRPIHHPLVLKTNFEEEEEVDEQNDYLALGQFNLKNIYPIDASSLWTKTPEEIEEKRAIKEMCYKSGEYYRFHTPPDILSSKSMAPTAEKELEKPLENGSELQEGDNLTVPTKLSQYERQSEIKTSLHGKPNTDIATFENGGGDCYVPQRVIFLGVDESEALTEEKEITISKCSNTKDNKDSPHPKRSLTTRLVPTTHVLNATENISMKCREDPSSMNDVQPVKKPHFKGVKKRKWIYDEPKNFPDSGMRRVQVPSPQNKMSYHRNNKNRNAENASYIHVQRDAVRTVALNAPPHSRPMHGSYNKVHVNKEPKPNLSPDKYMSTSYNDSAWRKQFPFQNIFKSGKIYPEPRRNGSK
ncbi:PREDICTED: uncharacterized protein C12orf50 homolog isoform X2 [Rhinopithecus bieti]|uniref:uncharacterized protein C12orf50 homolog isoform X2 n=1 Tax=Rhinopithecus bieti TaxID=61621 RepID=UPI00083C5CFF|nr:PREDICTED: uncharacterized protein C12orf50 homolog isoform X2 [Rhinopithecus bieti]